MLDRVERQPATLPGGWVAQHIRHHTVRHLVKNDRDDQRDEPGGHFPRQAIAHRHPSLRMENNTVSRTWPVQVMRSARMTPSRAAPSLAIAAWLRLLRSST